MICSANLLQPKLVLAGINIRIIVANLLFLHLASLECR